MYEYQKDITINEIVIESSASNRLKNIITSSERARPIANSTLEFFLKNQDYAYSQLRDIKSYGDKMEKELRELISFYDPIRSNEVISNTKEILNAVNEKHIIFFKPIINKFYESLENLNSAKNVFNCITQANVICKLFPINEKHFEIIVRRLFGETLESIGDDFGLSRERIRQIEGRYSENILSRKEWLRINVINLVEPNSGNILPRNERLYDCHPLLQRTMVKEFLGIDFNIIWGESKKEYYEKFKFYFCKDKLNLSPEGRYEIAIYLGLNANVEFSNFTKWTLDRVIFETRKCAKQLGKPDTMPMQKELISLGQNNLKAAIQRFGGQNKVASLAGLSYQGQIVSASGKRLYWTKNKIKSFLKHVAIEEGHPGYMPNQAACRKFANKPSTIISAITRASRSNLPTLSWEEAAKHYGFKYKKH